MAEEYKGIKFKVAFMKNKAPQNSKITNLKKWFEVFRDKKLAPVENGQAGGNLSFRIEKGKLPFIITGTQIGLQKKIDNSMFVKVLDCNFDKKIIEIEGLREPSSESFLHYAIYKARPDVNAIFHGHSKEILSRSQRVTLNSQGVIQNHPLTNFTIPCTKKETPYGSIELVDSVLEILDKNINFMIIKNHGFLSFGKTMKEANENIVKG